LTRHNLTKGYVFGNRAALSLTYFGPIGLLVQLPSYNSIH